MQATCNVKRAKAIFCIVSAACNLKTAVQLSFKERRVSSMQYLTSRKKVLAMSNQGYSKGRRIFNSTFIEEIHCSMCVGAWRLCKEFNLWLFCFGWFELAMFCWRNAVPAVLQPNLMRRSNCSVPIPPAQPRDQRENVCDKKGRGTGKWSERKWRKMKRLKGLIRAGQGRNEVIKRLG